MSRRRSYLSVSHPSKMRVAHKPKLGEKTKKKNLGVEKDKTWKPGTEKIREHELSAIL